MNRQPRFRADRLKEEVERLGIKPGKLAEELGISYETLYKTLRGDIAQPPAETLAKLALKTNCSIEYYMDLTESKAPANLELTEMQHAILRLLQTLPKSRQRDVLLMARTYAGDDEETAVQWLNDIKQMIFESADRAGRGADLDRYLQERIAQMLNGEYDEEQPSASGEDSESRPSDEDGEHGDSDGGDVPSE